MELYKLNDEEIIKLAKSNDGIERFYLYPELAKRANNQIIKEILFKDILDKEKREINLSPRGGIVKLAWIPIIEILLSSDNNIKNELRYLINKWTSEEQTSLKRYFKDELDYLKYLE